jgi:lipopolysaccharide transport system permease protein
MKPSIVIDAPARLRLNLGEVYQYRELMYMLAARDIRVRYTQTALGFAWSVFQPLATLAIFTFLFGRVIKIATGDIPYPLFAMAGITAWTYFTALIKDTGNVIINSQALIQKVYFPRLVLPLSKALYGLVDFAVSMALLFVVMLAYGRWPDANVVFFPVFVFFNILSGLSVGLWVSALTLRLRDLQHIVPVAVQLGMYVTPVAYPTALVPPQYQDLYYVLNPAVGVIEGYRWCLFGGTLSPYSFVSFGLMAVMLVLGLFYFKKVETEMADII